MFLLASDCWLKILTMTVPFTTIHLSIYRRKLKAYLWIKSSLCSQQTLTKAVTFDYILRCISFRCILLIFISVNIYWTNLLDCSCSSKDIKYVNTLDRTNTYIYCLKCVLQVVIATFSKTAKKIHKYLSSLNHKFWKINTLLNTDIIMQIILRYTYMYKHWHVVLVNNVN